MANWRSFLRRLFRDDADLSQGRGAVDADAVLLWANAFALPSRERMAAYDDLEDMEGDVVEITDALDTLADEAVYGEGEELPTPLITIEGGLPGAQRSVERLQHSVLTKDVLFQAARGTLLRGDKFLQPVVNADMLVTRIMTMAARSMYRKETEKGVLMRGNKPGKWAFEQRSKGSPTLLAGFYPWEIVHLRWRHDRERDGGLYGRGLMSSGRSDWRKLRAMEEALVINWLTRAFARLLFLIDVTSKSDTEAQQVVEDVKERLTKLSVAPGAKEQKFLTVVQDVFLGVAYHDFGGGRPEKGLTDVKVLDTASAGFSNLDPVEYYRMSLVRGTNVPPVYLGFEEETSTRNTLRAMDRRFGRCVRRIQLQILEPLVVHTTALQLVLQGADPAELRVHCAWPAPARADEQDQARTLFANARADEIYIKEIGLDIDPEWLLRKRYGTQPAGGRGRPEGDAGDA